MANDVFLSITPRDTTYIGGVNTGMRLRVIQNDGVDIKPAVKFNSVALNGGQTYFHNNTSNNDSFTISILLHKSDRVGNVAVIAALDYYMRHAIPFYVNTQAIGIKGTDLYLITENGSRNQSRKGYTTWELTFTKYKDIKASYFRTNSKGVNAAIKAHDKLTGLDKVKAKNTAYKQLAKCDRLKLVYSPKKKVLKCVQYLQYILYLQGFLKKNQINGWYDVNTKMAVKHYQQKYHKRDGLPISGNMNSATFRSLCGQVGPTIKAKSNLPKTNDFTHTKISNEIIIG